MTSRNKKRLVLYQKPPSFNSLPQERTDERMVRIKHRAGFVAFLAAGAGMIVLFTGLTFVSGLGTADICLYAWSYISFCLLV